MDSALLVFSFRSFGGDDKCGVSPPSLMRRVYARGSSVNFIDFLDVPELADNVNRQNTVA